MSAPAALICAKLAYPDDEQGKLTDETQEVTLEVVTNENKQNDPMTEKGERVLKDNIDGDPSGAESNLNDTKEINDERRRKSKWVFLSLLFVHTCIVL